jgi:hypothetical protein
VGRGHRSPVSPPHPQDIDGLYGVGGIPTGSNDGSTPRGWFSLTTHDLDAFRGRVAALGAWGQLRCCSAYGGVIFSDAGAEGLPRASVLPTSVVEEVVRVVD